jgi:hypothetical protein
MVGNAQIVTEPDQDGARRDGVAGFSGIRSLCVFDFDSINDAVARFGHLHAIRQHHRNHRPE